MVQRVNKDETGVEWVPPPEEPQKCNHHKYIYNSADGSRLRASGKGLYECGEKVVFRVCRGDDCGKVILHKYTREDYPRPYGTIIKRLQNATESTVEKHQFPDEDLVKYYVRTGFCTYVESWGEPDLLANEEVGYLNYGNGKVVLSRFGNSYQKAIIVRRINETK
jgi:hypothetical protein